MSTGYKYILTILLTVVGAFTAHADDKCPAVSATGDTAYPPLSWKAGNEIVGYTPDLARAIAKELGIKLTIHYSGSWRRAKLHVENGKYDVLLGMFKTEARLKDFVFTAPVIDDVISVATLQSNPVPYDGNWASLIGHAGSTTLGDSFGGKLDSYMSEHLSFFRTTSIAALVEQLGQGRISYAVHGIHALEYAIRQAGLKGTIRIMTPPLQSEAVYFAFSKKSSCHHLAEQFSRVIEQFRASGEMKRMLEHTLAKPQRK